MIKTIIFDWNGVIVDDIEAIARANCDIIEVLSGERVSVETWFKEITQDWKRFFMNYGVKEEDLPKVLPMMNKYYPKYSNHVKIKENVKIVLKKLKKWGMVLGVLSGNTKKSILDNIKRFSLEQYLRK